MSRIGLALLFLASACGGEAVVVRDSTTVDPPSAADDAERWPRDFVSGPGAGPALFLSETADSPAIGYVSEGVALRLGSLPVNGRVKVRIDGGLKVRGWIRMDRLSLRVQQAGRIGGTPVSVGRGDYVQIVGPDADETLLRVRVVPNLGRGAEEMAMDAFDGVYPLDRLAATDPGQDEASAGEPRRLPAGEPVQVYARPGEVIATIPTLDPPLVVELARDRGEWKGVRIGVGPYLAGYVNVALEPADALPTRQEEPRAEPGSVPLRLRVDESRPLWRLPVDTRIKYGDETIGILATEGYAREMGRYEETGEVDVFVAIDDGVALRGTVPIASLQAIDPNAAATPAAPTAPAAQ